MNDRKQAWHAKLAAWALLQDVQSRVETCRDCGVRIPEALRFEWDGAFDAYSQAFDDWAKTMNAWGNKPWR